ncbi:MAG: PrsW family intramembrane metalloprotease [Candidatus Azambacteria bacterium]|nr:PrsW family intramembrane metalloprotease [Candidatus Azambacteria bacterium]
MANYVIMIIAHYSLGKLAFLIALGITPSLIWMWYYLRKDINPEPKGMVLKVFLFGFCSTFIAFGIEWVLITALLDLKTSCPRCELIIPQLLGATGAGPILFTLSFMVLGILAFVEEWVKFVAARLEIIRSRYFDEPVDAMIYCVIAALGFAAAENIGYILQNADYAIGIAYFRFISSTLLHTFASAILGYFFALSIIHATKRIVLVSTGLALATVLHTLFNFLIITSEQGGYTMALVILLMVFSYFFVLHLFERVKKLSFVHIS